jgi:acetylornithine deacetylase
MGTTDFEAAYGDRLCDFTDELLGFDTTDGNEAPAQQWFRDRLAEFGFETHSWYADAERLSEHPSFPPAADLDCENRPNVAGVIEFGDPDRGRTLLLNGHMDVVPATASHWATDPFAAHRAGDRLTARGAADMKSQLAACVFATRFLADRAESGDFPIDSVTDTDLGLDGRIVVESVAGEEEGGIGAAAAAIESPYPFDIDGAIVAEPTDMRVVTATEGCLMGRIRIDGQAAHAARRWEGTSVLPCFERVRETLADLEADRCERLSHPLYDRFEIPWPIVIGRVEAGTWASNVPDVLTAELRVGVAPGESVASVEADCRERITNIDADSRCSISVERFGIQFEPASIDPTEPVVTALRNAMTANGLEITAPTGETYGADARHLIDAGIPAVVFGPGCIEQAHFPDESIHWPAVLQAGGVLAGTAWRFLAKS